MAMTEHIFLTSATARGFFAVACALSFAVSALAMDAGDTLCVMTYNIHHGAGADGKVDLQRIADVIMRENPDFVGLNEVDCGTGRSGGVDEAAELGRIAGFHATFAKAIPYQGGGYGNAVLSRDKPVSVVRVPLPGKEPRVLLLCEYANFWFGTAHLHSGESQLKSVEIIRRIVEEKSKTKPVFLTGDWNATPESATLAATKEFLTVLSNERCRTGHGFRSYSPESEHCIDYIAVDSGHAADVKVDETHITLNAVASDHNPVFASVRLSAGGGNVK